MALLLQSDTFNYLEKIMLRKLSGGDLSLKQNVQLFKCTFLALGKRRKKNERREVTRGRLHGESLSETAVSSCLTLYVPQVPLLRQDLLHA